MSAKRSWPTRSLVAGVPALCRRARPSLLMYRDARERLRGLGFICTDGAIAGQFGEWLAARCLGLQLAQSNVRKAYDAVDRAGQTFQIKARIVSGLRTSTSFDFRKPLSRFDFLLGVLMSKRFDVLAIVRVPHAAVRRYAHRNRSGYRLRWTRRSFSAPWVDVMYLASNTKGDSAENVRRAIDIRGPKGK